MARNKYLLLISSLGVLALLVAAIVQEHWLREWRRIQRRARSAEGPVPVYLRQVVNTTLGRADRCVSCHLRMAPGETPLATEPVLAAHPPLPHDPLEFGCTTCHGGQGQATDEAHAHGNVPFWPEPMLPLRFAEAGCGTCHSPSGIPEAQTLAEARLAFERLDCLACHRVDGRGGTLRPGAFGMEGPDLSYVGLKGFDHQWYAKHLAKVRHAPAGPWSAFREIDEDDLERLRIFLESRIGAPRLVEGQAVFYKAGCLGCHKVSGVGGDEGPDLSQAGLKDPGRLNAQGGHGSPRLVNWLLEHFRSPSSVVANSQMPAVTLSDRELELLTLYTLSLRRRDLPSSFTPRDRIRTTRLGEREFRTDGATLYAAFCSGCHGSRGLGLRSAGMPAFPAVAHPDLLQLVSDQFLIATIARGRPGRRMPAWARINGGLSAQEIRTVVLWLRRLGGADFKPDGRPRRWVNADASHGRRLYRLACAGCHGPNGEGGEGPALNNPVLLEAATDSFLFETIRRGRRGTAMPAFSQPSPAHPTLAAEEIASVVAFLRSWERPAPPNVASTAHPASGERNLP